jgi:SAM-dependent methyltransferase
LTQAVTDQAWHEEAQDIYRRYEIYHQSNGAEQPVFNPSTGERQSRSAIILDQLMAARPLPAHGRLLDVGCGNGGFLRTCSAKLPGWSLAGSEFDTRHRATIEAIPHVEGLFSGPLETIPGTFDVISLIHVLEHITGPTAFLQQLASKLNSDGLLLIEVPDCTTNPFILLVADHCSHFSPSSLSAVVTAAGFEVLSLAPGRVPKEITLLARRPQSATESHQIGEQARVLASVAREAAGLAASSAIGIFGTSVAATWLDAQLDGRPVFFVDEDADRIGGKLGGRPILSPDEVTAGSTVYVALAPALAKGVASRLRAKRPDVNFVVPGERSATSR